MTTLWLRLVFALMCAVIAGAATLDMPVRVQRGAIVVRAEAGLEKDAREVAAKAPVFLKAIYEDLPNLDVPPRVEIRLVRRSSSLPLAAPPGRGAPSWASGVAYSDVGVVTVAKTLDTEINDVMSTTSHELSHLALGAALHGNAPRWLNEGFAYLHSSDWSMARVQVLAGMAWSGNTIPLHDLDRSFPAAESEVHKAYAQSYDFVAFLARRGRYADPRDDGDRWPFRNFLKAIAEGESVEVAARTTFGATLDDLYQEWQQDLKTRYMLVPASLFGLFIWTFAAFLLVLGYLRKRRRARKIMARWTLEDASADAARSEYERSRLP